MLSTETITLTLFLIRNAPNYARLIRRRLLRLMQTDQRSHCG